MSVEQAKETPGEAYRRAVGDPVTEPFPTQKEVDRERELMAKIANKRITLAYVDPSRRPETHAYAERLLDTFMSLEVSRTRSHAGLADEALSLADIVRDRIVEAQGGR